MLVASLLQDASPLAQLGRHFGRAGRLNLVGETVEQPSGSVSVPGTKIVITDTQGGLDLQPDGGPRAFERGEKLLGKTGVSVDGVEPLQEVGHRFTEKPFPAVELSQGAVHRHPPQVEPENLLSHRDRVTVQPGPLVRLDRLHPCVDRLLRAAFPHEEVAEVDVVVDADPLRRRRMRARGAGAATCAAVLRERLLLSSPLPPTQEHEEALRTYPCTYRTLTSCTLWMVRARAGPARWGNACAVLQLQLMPT